MPNRKPRRGEIRTRRWNEPTEPGDGLRVLICRYRPRGVRKEAETWDEWYRALAPSRALHAAVYGKDQRAIGFAEYRRRFLVEMDSDLVRFHLRALASRVGAGESVTLLCSSACADEQTCHRGILRELVEGLLATRAS